MILTRIKQLIKEELEDFISSNNSISFEDNPLEFIIQKYPSLDATIAELLTNEYRDYITGIYVMAPKPTTFRVLLHNGQEFYLIYGPKAYIVKISGKKYNLMNLVEEQFAIKSIAQLLELGMPPGSKGPEESFNNDPGIEGDKPIEEEPAEGEPEEIKESLNTKPKSKFRILESKGGAKFGYKIGEFITPSETLQSRSWFFKSKVGYLGTGYYFYGDEKNASQDKKTLNRGEEIKKIDLSKYNLYRSSNPTQFYDTIKDLTQQLGLYALEGSSLSEEEEYLAFEEVADIIVDELNLPLETENVIKIIMGFVQDVRDKKDGPLISNRLLIPLGYDGIDNTNTSLDNYGVGSVIFP